MHDDDVCIENVYDKALDDGPMLLDYCATTCRGFVTAGVTKG